MPTIVVSNDLKQLCDDLVDEIGLLRSVRVTIVVPEPSIRAWLCHELAKRNISLLRVEVLLVGELFKRFFPIPPLYLLPMLTAFFQKRGTLSGELQTPFSQARYYLLSCAWQLFVGEKEALPKELAEDFLQSLSSSKDEIIGALFLFGFSSLNARVLERVLPTCVSLYALSPCMLYWGDVCSDVEARGLLSYARKKGVSHPSEERLEELLFDRHRLLANSGHIGREFLLLLEENKESVKSRYIFPESLSISPYTELLPPEVILQEQQKSLLEYLKADMLLLAGAPQEPIHLPKDRSLELHAAPTPLREVEALRERLSVMGEIGPARIIVLVSDLSRYRAAIEEVFGGERKPFYQMVGGFSPDGPITVLRMLFSLLSSKNSSSEWLQLLHHPLFQQSLSMSAEEAQSVREWLKKLPPSWGLSENHRARYLQNRGIEAKETKGGFAAEQEAYSSLFLDDPKDHFSCSELPAIASFLHFLAQLEPFMLPIEPKREALLSYWKSLFQTLSQGMMAGEGGYEEEAIAEAIASIDEIIKATEDVSFPWAGAKDLFFQLMDAACEQRYIDLRSPMIVAEFGRFQPFPADLVAILGAQDGQLPRYSQERLLTRLHKMVHSLPASNAFLDRYSIIEAILSARALFIGYQAYDFAANEAIPLAPAIADIFTHLDEHYLIDGLPPSKALIHQHGTTRPFRFQESFTPLPAITLESPKGAYSVRVDPQALKKVAKSPIEMYYKARFGYESTFKDEDMLFVKPWEVKRAIDGMPTTSWAAREAARTLASVCVDSPLYDVYLIPTAHEASIDHEKNRIICPSIQCGPSLEICGVWSALRKDGAILIREDWKKELFQQWSEIIFRSYVTAQYGVPIYPKVILVKENRAYTLECSHELQDWVEFVSQAMEHPFPFTFDIVKQLLSESDTVLSSIQAHALIVGGAWKCVVHQDLQTQLPLWTAWAKRLYAPFFSAVESL